MLGTAAHWIRAPGRPRPWRAVLPQKPRSICARRGPRLRPRRALPGEDSGTKSDFQTGRRAASEVVFPSQPTFSCLIRSSPSCGRRCLWCRESLQRPSCTWTSPVCVRVPLSALPAAVCTPGVVSALLCRPCGGWDAGSDGLCAEPTAGAPGGPRLCSRGTQCLQGLVMWEPHPPRSLGPPCRTDPWTSTPEVLPGPPPYCCDLRPCLGILIRGPAGAPRVPGRALREALSSNYPLRRRLSWASIHTPEMRFAQLPVRSPNRNRSQTQGRGLKGLPVSN